MSDWLARIALGARIAVGVVCALRCVRRRVSHGRVSHGAYRMARIAWRVSHGAYMARIAWRVVLCALRCVRFPL
jgi:hypothetical protein